MPSESRSRLGYTPEAASSCSPSWAWVVDAGCIYTWRAKGPFVIFGSGAAKCADVLSDAVLVHVAPSARGLARLAQTAFDGGDFADLAYFEPFYLKDFVVTTSRKKLF